MLIIFSKPNFRQTLFFYIKQGITLWGWIKSELIFGGSFLSLQILTVAGQTACNQCIILIKKHDFLFIINKAAFSVVLEKRRYWYLAINGSDGFICLFALLLGCLLVCWGVCLFVAFVVLLFLVFVCLFVCFLRFFVCF